MATRDKHVGNINPAPLVPLSTNRKLEKCGGRSFSETWRGAAAMDVIGPFSQILMSLL